MTEASESGCRTVDLGNILETSLVIACFSELFVQLSNEQSAG
jgi:hypothetical protein